MSATQEQAPLRRWYLAIELALVIAPALAKPLHGHASLQMHQLVGIRRAAELNSLRKAKAVLHRDAACSRMDGQREIIERVDARPGQPWVVDSDL
jgi:hypothetical protein